MRPDVLRDLSRSARDFVEVVWPEIQHWFDGGELRPTELAGPEAEVFDIHAGIDAWQIFDGRMRGIASRVQYAPHLCSSFTIRSQRRSGTTTELAKRLQALDEPERGWLTPALTIQAYIDEDHTLAGAACVRTSDLYRYVRDGRPTWDYTVMPNTRDGNRFYVVWWENLRAAGVHVRTVGENRLDSRYVKRAAA